MSGPLAKAAGEDMVDPGEALGWALFGEEAMRGCGDDGRAVVL